MINSFVAFLDRTTIFDRLAKFYPITPLAIVMYHNIGKKEIAWLNQKPFPIQMFEMQIRYLKKAGYSILPLGEALSLISKGKSPKRIAVLTFDDGYNGVYKYAFPIIRKYNIRCTVFVSSSFVKCKAIPWWEQIAFIIYNLNVPTKLDLAPFKTLIISTKNEKIRLEKNLIHYLWNKDVESITSYIKELLDASNIDISSISESHMMLRHDELEEMVEYGIEIGGHGAYHVSLPPLTPNRLHEELNKSYTFVREFSRSNFNTFAYPLGEYSESVIEGLRKVGFDAAVTMIPAFVNNIKSLNLYKLSRIPPYWFDEGMMASFKCDLMLDNSFAKKFRWIQSLVS
jgi:peptidoglycan/xylan/chitin deacetylase (PgdA/CDA1 family)